MLSLLKKKSQTSIGIDIGTAFIKAVVIDKSKDVPKLTAFSYEPTQEDKVTSVKKAISKLKIQVPTAANVTTSISGPSTVVRIVEMPNMTDNELKSAFKYEAEKCIPYKLDEVVTDYIKIEKLAGEKIRVLLVAAKKSVVNNRIELLSKAGLPPNIIDVDSFAVMNAFLNFEGENADKATCALINIGAAVTNLNIIRGQQSYLTRDIQIAGDDITKAIAGKLNLEKDKAEALKTNPGNSKSDVELITKSAVFSLLDEIRLSFDFYENHCGESIQKIYMSGGSSRLEGLNDLIKDISAADIVYWDPFTNIDIDSNVDAAALRPMKSSFAVAVGLGLRGR